MTVWLAGAIVLPFMESAGGDISIFAGWVFLVWTAPFGAIWWFWLYNYTTSWIPPHISQPLGESIVILVAFVFWFILFPKIRGRKLTKTAQKGQRGG